MKAKRTTLALLTVLLVTLLFTACVTNPVKFELYFRVDGMIYSTISTTGHETIAAPKDPVKEGYTFDGWYWDDGVWERPFTANSLLEAPISSNMSVYAKFTKIGDKPVEPIDPVDPVDPVVPVDPVDPVDPVTPVEPVVTTAAYKVEYYLENALDNDYTKTTEVVLQGTISQEVTAEIKEYEHFTATETAVKGTVNKEGTLVLKVYYKRDVYTVTFNSNGGTLVSGTEVQNVKYLASAKAPSYKKDGYEFIGFNVSFAEVTSDLAVTATWKLHVHTFAKEYSSDADYHWRASTCGHQDAVEKEEHMWELNKVLSEPTVSQNGMSVYKCLVCEKLKQVQVPYKPISHAITYIDEKFGDEYVDQISANKRSYYEHEGITLPTLKAEGYEFKGWRTAEDGNGNGSDIIKYIPANSNVNYVVYAVWEAIEYTITYRDAPKNENNPATYTIESDFWLADPVWDGLSFYCWKNEADDELIENGKSSAKIEKGTTGNLVFTAKWSYTTNIAVQNKDQKMQSYYDKEKGLVCFAYDLGTIRNFVISTNTEWSRTKTTSQGYDEEITLTTDITTSASNTIAAQVANTIANSNTWSKEITSTAFTSAMLNSVTLGSEKVFSIGATGALGSTETNTTGSVISGSTSSTESSSEMYSATISYEATTEYVRKINLVIPDSFPNGSYYYALLSDVEVYAFITVKPTTNEFCISLYSVFGNCSYGLAYEPLDKNRYDIKERTQLELNVSDDELEELFNNNFYQINYNTNYPEKSFDNAEDEVNCVMMPVGAKLQLNKNEYATKGYTFKGWATTEKGNVEYKDSQSINNIASAGTQKNLYAVWEINKYNVQINANYTGLLRNVYADKNMEGNDMDVRYVAKENKFTLVPLRGSKDPHCVIPQYVDLEKGKTYYAHMIAKDATGKYFEDEYVQLFLAINNEFTEEQSLWFGSTKTKEFTVTESGRYNIRFDLDNVALGNDVYITNFYITDQTEIYCDDMVVEHGFKFDKMMILPQKQHYNFGGYYSKADGNGDCYVNVMGNSVKMVEGDLQLHVLWKQSRQDYTYISTVKGLQDIKVNLSGKYMLINDIDLIGQNWTPLGTFTGVLEGNGYCINNLRYEYDNSGKDEDCFGLMRRLSGNAGMGEVKNIVFSNINMSIKSNDGDNTKNMYIGVICGALEGGTISNIVILNSEIKGSHYTYKDDPNDELKIQIGAITGVCRNGVISNCLIKSSTVDGYVSLGEGEAKAHANAGGVVGELLENSVARNCEVQESTINSQAKGCANNNWLGVGDWALLIARSGGVVGYMGEGAKIDNCHTYRNTIFAKQRETKDDWIRQGSERFSSNICGKTDKGTITNCTYYGDTLYSTRCNGNDDETANGNCLSLDYNGEDKYGYDYYYGELGNGSGNNKVGSGEGSNKQNTIYIIEGSEERFDNTQMQI